MTVSKTPTFPLSAKIEEAVASSKERMDHYLGLVTADAAHYFTMNGDNLFQATAQHHVWDRVQRVWGSNSFSAMEEGQRATALLEFVDEQVQEFFDEQVDVMSSRQRSSSVTSNLMAQEMGHAWFNARSELRRHGLPF